MAVKFYTEKLLENHKKQKKKFLHEAGDIGVNEWVSKSPYDTGKYKNSIVKKVEDEKQSAYNTFPNKSGKNSKKRNKGEGKLSNAKKRYSKNRIKSCLCK